MAFTVEILPKGAKLSPVATSIVDLIVTIGIRYNDTAEAAICRNLVRLGKECYIDIYFDKNKINLDLHFPNEFMHLARLSTKRRVSFEAAIATKNLAATQKKLLLMVDEVVYEQRGGLRVMYSPVDGVTCSRLTDRESPFKGTDKVELKRRTLKQDVGGASKNAVNRSKDITQISKVTNLNPWAKQQRNVACSA